MMNDPSERNDAASADAESCAQCGAPFRCGVRAGDAACWCAALPALPHDRLSPGVGCLCPACLTRLTAQIERASRPA
ncbi:cysteine-rich CWC family protein [Caballeronia insecticola]|uniref:Cysteine-rich CWC n=1 Tax=Caballeronia insecticola TaxID=758793 RepID=R4WSG5_9BURK|nr:cysteine-rich CWC family protein [Caballeronia insecticola]BAN21811.1 putative uncharacterized protein [Caballeronia insecticola]